MAPHCGSDGKKIRLQCRRPGFDPWVGKIPWRRAWQPLQYSCLENSHEQRRLAGCSPRCCKESDKTERLSRARAPLFLELKNMAFEPLDDLGSAADLHISPSCCLILSLFQIPCPSLSLSPVTELWYLVTTSREWLTQLFNQVTPLLQISSHLTTMSNPPILCSNSSMYFHFLTLTTDIILNISV